MTTRRWWSRKAARPPLADIETRLANVTEQLEAATIVLQEQVATMQEVNMAKAGRQ